MSQQPFQISRRELLLVSAAAVAVGTPTVLMAAPHVTSHMSKGEEAVYDVRYVVTDRRYPQSLAYAQELGSHKVIRLEVTEGLTRLWQEQLDPLWQVGNGAVTGLTTRAVWECLAEQARTHALRTRSLTELTQNDGHPESLVSWIIA